MPDPLPVSHFYSTYLNSRVDSITRLSDRIARSLGYPLINIDAHQDQVYENIAIATEMFTKYAGYSLEYLVFDSKLYTQGQGIRVDQLITITDYLSAPTVTVAASASNAYTIGQMFVGDNTEIFPPMFTVGASGDDQGMIKIPAGWEDLIGDWRRVVDIWSFEEGASSGINTLFTIEQALAQQTYFSYSMGNYGFDLISWYVLKNWLEVREKILSVKRDLVFNDKTQQLIIIPEPTAQQSFYGIIGCYVEKPLREMMRETWVYQYALALTKINIGRVRGKFENVPLFGGGQLSKDLLAEGLEEKKYLEEKLFESAPGFGDAAPPMFFIG